MTLPISSVAPPRTSPQPKAPQQRTNFIRVRTFKNSDGDAAARVFREGLVVGPTSARAAVLRGSLRGRIAVINYLVFTLGAMAIVASPHLHSRLGGAILAGLAVAFFFVHRITLKKIYAAHAAGAAEHMKTISKHYKIVETLKGTSSLTGPNGFWVAELLEEGCTEGVVVGCVGLDTSIPRSPGCAELRRMAVLAKLQRRGIGRMLLETALAHAKAHGITTIWLTTNAHQRSAVGIYEKYGWKNMGWSVMKTVPFWADARIMDWKLDLVGEQSGMGNKEWEKVA